MRYPGLDRWPHRPVPEKIQSGASDPGYWSDATTDLVRWWLELSIMHQTKGFDGSMAIGPGLSYCMLQ
jgi:hypothetical protein